MAGSQIAQQTSRESQELAQRVGVDASRIDFISKKYCSGAPAIEVEHFIRFAQAQGLDISAKQAYLIGRKNKEGGKDYTIQIAIDGYRAIAEASEEYDGQDPAVFAYDAKGNLLSATVTVYRKNMTRGVAATAFFREYNAGNSMWTKMPHGQLAKCAEALALRKAFPKRLGGTYTGEEMDQAGGEMRVVSAQISDQKSDEQPAKKTQELSPLQKAQIEAFADILAALGWDPNGKERAPDEMKAHAYQMLADMMSMPIEEAPRTCQGYRPDVMRKLAQHIREEAQRAADEQMKRIEEESEETSLIDENFEHSSESDVDADGNGNGDIPEDQVPY